MEVGIGMQGAQRGVELPSTSQGIPVPKSAVSLPALPCLAPGRRADDPRRRVIPTLDGRLHRTSPLRSQSQPRLLGDVALCELVHRGEEDVNDGHRLSAVASARPDRPRRPDAL
jgi:hypothetical protein